MASPFYVSPEQFYTEKADYARKNIARGKPVVALDYEHGLITVAENRSSGLRKLSEIYDRISFAAVGKFDEYESLRKAGVRYADMRGFSYAREDVAASNLANEYSTMLGSIFTREMKPFEVEILVCEVGRVGEEKENIYFQILYDGFITDHRHYATIGGDPDQLREVLKEGWKDGLDLGDALRLGLRALDRAEGSSTLDKTSLEVTVLDRRRDGRKYRRLSESEVGDLLGG